MLRPIESDDFLSSMRIGDNMIASAMLMFLRRIANCCGKWLCLKKEMIDVVGSNNWGPGGHGVWEPSAVSGEQVLSACVVRALPL